MTILAPLLAAAALAQGTPAPAPATAMPTTIEAVAAGNRRFALNLYRRLQPDADGNLFFSPSSMGTSASAAWP